METIYLTEWQTECLVRLVEACESIAETLERVYPEKKEEGE